MSSTPDRPFATLSDAELYALIEMNAKQQAQVDGLRGLRSPTFKRVQVTLRQEGAKLNEERICRDLPSSASDADYIAAKVAEFDRDFPIPKIDADHSTIRNVSSGDDNFSGVVGSVCTLANLGAK